MESESSMTDLRIASFAAYLDTAHDNLMKKLPEPVQLPPSFVIPDEDYSMTPIRPGKIVPKDSEIGVFGAEKYFNMNIDDDDPTSTTPRLVGDYTRKLGLKRENRADPYYGSSKVKLGTPSVSSESSWGSQTSFLRSFQRNSSQNRESNRGSDHRGFLSGFSCHRSCADRKSIHVSERGKGDQEVSPQSKGNALLGASGRKLPSQSPRAAALQSRNEFLSPSFEKSRSGSKRMEPFTFPVLNSNAQAKEVLMNSPKLSNLLMEPRISLEVFGSKARHKPGNIVAANLERKLSMLTWDAIPKPHIHKSHVRLDDDIGSEASSELFEIENITGSPTIPPSTCYEPSEASIEWSVVTASAADFSVVSEYDQKELLADIRGRNNILTNRNRPNDARSCDVKEVQKSRPSGLLGCKDHKAVQVNEPMHKMGDQPRTPRAHIRLEAAVP